MRKGILFSFVILLFASCSDQMPYLDIKTDLAAGSYTAGDSIAIEYDFSSETDPQRCRVRLYETSNPDYYLMDNEDGELRRYGVLYTPFLKSGTYIFEFVVLSDRNGEIKPLWFLSNYQTFTIP